MAITQGLKIRWNLGLTEANSCVNYFSQTTNSVCIFLPVTGTIPLFIHGILLKESFISYVQSGIAVKMVASYYWAQVTSQHHLEHVGNCTLNSRYSEAKKSCWKYSCFTVFTIPVTCSDKKWRWFTIEQF